METSIREREFSGLMGWIRGCRYDATALADALEITSWQLVDSFECITGKAPFYWLTEIRLWEAARLLCEGFLPAQAASELFFETERDFCREFQLYHEVRPDEFIAAHQRTQQRRRAELGRIFEGKGIHEDWRPKPPWAHALHILCGDLPRHFAEAMAKGRARSGKGPNDRDFRPSTFDFRQFLLRSLHARCCRGGSNATDVLADIVWQPLIRRLSAEFRRLDHEIILDAVEMALMAYVRKPARFNPERGDLEPFFYMAALRNASNLNRRLRGRRCEPLPNDAALDFRKNHNLTSPSPMDVLIENENESERQELLEQRRQRVREFSETLNGVERSFIELKIAGERNFAPYARILAMTSKSSLERRNEVNRVKNRLQHRLKRWLARSQKPGSQADKE